jgi:hypothetical protein
MTLIAKPVIDKQFWILQEGNQKVGNIEACAGGYQVKIRNQVAQFKTIRMAAQRVNIQFETADQAKPEKRSTNLIHGYPAAGKIYNPMWDVKMKLPVYTKTIKSKSWFAAGWYRVRKGRSWSIMQDPKLIVLQRYAYQGPYHTQEQAQNESTHTTFC